MKVKKQLTQLLFFLLLLIAAGCQLISNSETGAAPTAVPIDSNAIIQDAVATVEAQLPVNSEPGTLAEPTSNPNLNSTVPTAGLEGRLVSLYDQLNPSVVHIFLFDTFGEQISTGSGFVFDRAGHIVTNQHVIAVGETIEVVFADGQRRRARLVGADEDSDLAVIRVELPSDIQPIPVGNSDQLRVGQFVVAIGNPFGESGSMTVGIVSGLGRTLLSARLAPGLGNFSLPQVIQTDAAINPGNSGGPLLNLNGEVVGINSRIATNTGVNSGVGFSIPSNAVRRIVPSLIETGQFEYSYIGISMWGSLTLAELERYNLPPNGVYITSVQPESPASRAGLVGSGFDNTNTPLTGGDYITAVNGQPIRNSDELISYLLFNTKVGDTIELSVIRDGQTISLPLTLASRP